MTQTQEYIPSLRPLRDTGGVRLMMTHHDASRSNSDRMHGRHFIEYTPFDLHVFSGNDVERNQFSRCRIAYSSAVDVRMVIPRANEKLTSLLGDNCLIVVGSANGI